MNSSSLPSPPSFDWDWVPASQLPSFPPPQISRGMRKIPERGAAFPCTLVATGLFLRHLFFQPRPLLPLANPELCFLLQCHHSTQFLLTWSAINLFLLPLLSHFLSEHSDTIVPSSSQVGHYYFFCERKLNYREGGYHVYCLWVALKIRMLAFSQCLQEYKCCNSHMNTENDLSHHCP